MLLPLALAQFICSYAASNMNVAISNIAHDLHTNVHGVQLTITLFTLIMAAFMIPGSKLTDIWGRKRCFVLGLFVYGIGTVIAAFAPTLGVLLIGYSVFEGIGTALLIPPVYILVTISFSDLAKRARSFGMKIVAITQPPFSRKGADKTYYVDNIAGPENLLQLLIDADYVSIHTPLSDETRNMIGEKELNFMKKSAYLINVARAPIVDREALFVALKTRSIAGAAFDVFWNEPPTEDEKLLQLDNFILTSHIAGWTNESVEATGRIIAINIARISRGEVPLTVVNSELIL